MFVNTLDRHYGSLPNNAGILGSLLLLYSVAVNLFPTAVSVPLAAHHQ
ncbi:hypothetical protein [Chamaesiphon sp. VAR_69_metabat_338]|nr:hypothetical protein [Chamaesiphon sp. VAR_69_metabat_338]